MEGCEERRLLLRYPGHRFDPTDLLVFIESSGYMEEWDAMGLDLENDAVSLQACIMIHPEGDGEIVDGVRYHIHSFGSESSTAEGVTITAYYTIFDDYGIAYMVGLDQSSKHPEFSEEEVVRIEESISRTRREIESLQRIE